MKKIPVIVTLKEEVSDPEGTVITHSLHSTGHTSIQSVRCGKYFELEVPEDMNQEEIEAVCRDVLSNPVIEEYRILTEEKI